MIRAVILVSILIMLFTVGCRRVQETASPTGVRVPILYIDMDGTLLDFDYREVRVSRAIIDNSRRIFLATDHTKFGRNAMVRLGSIDEIDALFTDRPPPQALSEVLGAADIELYVASKTDKADL